MDPRKAYINCFLYLDAHFNRTKNNDLGLVLGSMSPFLWSGFKPIDIWFIETWLKLCSNIDYDDKTIFSIVVPNYLIQFDNEFKTDLSFIVNSIQNDALNEYQLWSSFKGVTNDTYEKYKILISAW
jgi:hypothetical protein